MAEYFRGCLHGFNGMMTEANDITALGFYFQYDKIERCAVEVPEEEDLYSTTCMCQGNVYFGLQKDPEDDNANLLYEGMLEQTFVKKEGVNGGIECNSASFGSDPHPGQNKQCFCERTSWDGFFTNRTE